MGFFDNAANRRPKRKLEVGDSVTGRIDDLAVVADMGDPRLSYTINGTQRYANGRLWDAFTQSGADIGSTVTVERLPDDTKQVGPFTPTNWAVTVHGRTDQPPATATTAAPPVTAPQPEHIEW